MATRFLTPNEYLAIERATEVKSEYISGEMFVMDGANRNHSLLVGNTGSQFYLQLQQSSCETYLSSMRVRATPSSYIYPDIVVCCGEPLFEDDQLDTLLNPTVIVEVLSKSTENWDRGGKFERYRRLDSLTDYILVSQSEYLVEQRTRQTYSTWLLREIEGHAGVVNIKSIGCTLTIADLYHQVVISDNSD